MTSTRTSRPPLRAPVAVFATTLLIAACGGGGSDPYPPGTDLPADEAAAVRFLTQASFGADDASIERLQYLGYETWLREQQELPVSLHRPDLEARVASGEAVFQSHRQNMWWRRALTARDQLRQRMAFALSEIFVVSDRGSGLENDVIGLATYYDMLLEHAFGNYRDLLAAVTLSPQMGIYLSHLRNRKPDPARNIRPDENYAREVMQLFSIGLVELEQDGSVRLDGQGQPIPTYDQDDIVALAHVFTGWNYAGAISWNNYTANPRPMEPFEAFHDQQQKTVLGSVFPAGRSAQQELDQALDLLAAHPNTGPFLGKQLIQRFVTSNPSPAYVARIAAVWADDGAGVRGNLGAVLRAVLLDDEAKNGPTLAATTFGKVREPLLLQSALWRALRARCPDQSYTFANPENVFGQAALRSSTVFNFFRPDHAPQGEIADANLLSPEFEILGHTTVTSTVNQIYTSVFNRRLGAAGTQQNQILIDPSVEVELAADPTALVDHLDRRLLGGGMPTNLRSVLLAHLAGESDPLQRALDAIYLIATSPQFFVQR